LELVLDCKQCRKGGVLRMQLYLDHRALDNRELYETLVLNGECFRVVIRVGIAERL